MRTRPGQATTRGGSTIRALTAPLSGVVALLAGLGFLLTADVPAAAAPPPQGWSTTEAPLPSDAGTNPNVYLASSSCPTPTNCVAAGWYEDTGGHPWGLIETQNGTTWTDVQAPQPSNAGSGVDQSLLLGSGGCGVLATPCHAVSCPTATSCVAVGQYKTTGAFTQAVIVTLSGGTWTALQAPVPGDAAPGPSPNPFATLQSVVCSSPTSCVAVGEYLNSSNVPVAMIDTLSGTTWTSVSSPLPGDANTAAVSRLTTLSCATASSCVATGSYSPMTGGQGGLIAVLAGGTWTATGAPLPGNGVTSSSRLVELLEVSCSSPTFCVTTGLYNDTSGNDSGLIDTYASGSWSATTAPVPGDALSTGTGHATFLSSVSCATSTACVAVGFYPVTGGGQRGLINMLSGGSWSALATPLPGNAEPVQGGNQLQTVSCPTPTFCMASGFYETAGNVVTGYQVTLQGGTWNSMVTSIPSPNSVNGSNFLSLAKFVDCYSPVACNVVGTYSDPGNTQGFLNTWTGAQGYWLDASDGGIFTYPNNIFFGSTGGLKLNKPMVGMAATADAQGYWLVASDGGIFSYGDALFHGSRGGQPLNKPIVGMAATPDGGGYWLVASDGGIFAYGDAGYFGSRGGQPINAPIVGMATTPDGRGYWLVGADGGIYSYGDAAFQGSTGALKLNKPVVGMAATPTGLGYWLVASDGGIFNYGDAAFYGSTGSLVLNKPVVGMAGSPSGRGYWLVASDGGIFNYGDAPFQGSAGALRLNAPVVGMAGG